MTALVHCPFRRANLVPGPGTVLVSSAIRLQPASQFANPGSLPDPGPAKRSAPDSNRLWMQAVCRTRCVISR